MLSLDARLGERAGAVNIHSAIFSHRQNLPSARHL
jgi:hypothetical protein